MDINIVAALAMLLSIIAVLPPLIVWQSPDMLKAIICRLLTRVAYIKEGRRAEENERKRWAAMQEGGNV